MTSAHQRQVVGIGLGALALFSVGLRCTGLRAGNERRLGVRRFGLSLVLDAAETRAGGLSGQPGHRRLRQTGEKEAMR